MIEKINLLDLPNDVLFETISYLSELDKLKLRLINQKFKKFIEDQLLWSTESIREKDWFNYFSYKIHHKILRLKDQDLTVANYFNFYNSIAIENNSDIEAFQRLVSDFDNLRNKIADKNDCSIKIDASNTLTYISILAFSFLLSAFVYGDIENFAYIDTVSDQCDDIDSCKHFMNENLLRHAMLATSAAFTLGVFFKFLDYLMEKIELTRTMLPDLQSNRRIEILKNLYRKRNSIAFFIWLPSTLALIANIPFSLNPKITQCFSPGIYQDDADIQCLEDIFYPQKNNNKYNSWLVGSISGYYFSFLIEQLNKLTQYLCKRSNRENVNNKIEMNEEKGTQFINDDNVSKSYKFSSITNFFSRMIINDQNSKKDVDVILLEGVDDLDQPTL